MEYNVEKEKREAIEAGQRESEQCKELGIGGYVWWWIFYYDDETIQDGPGKEEYGSGEIGSS